MISRLADNWRTLKDLVFLRRNQKLFTPSPFDTKDGYALRIQAHAERAPDHPCIEFEGRSISYGELNALANRMARRLADCGLKTGNVAAVEMENSIEFLAVFLALNKLGVAASFMNTNLRGRQLAHCLTVSEPKVCIFGEELREAVEEVKSDLALREGRDYFMVGDSTTPNWAENLLQTQAEMSSENLAVTADITLRETSMHLFTSGTTGLPKAAIVSNRRALFTSFGLAQAGFRASPGDRIYVPLPLYHGTGLLVGALAAMVCGATVILRRKFSASQFWDEVRESRATCLTYIGEILRYLMNQPERPDDRNHSVERIVGNGLRPDIFKEFRERFGIERITEFYGASEGNIAFLNLLNKDCSIGFSTGEFVLASYDVEADAIRRDDSGRVVPADLGEPGLLLGKITPETLFEGYTDTSATEGKIVRDVLESGDAWFNSGDLIREVDVGWTAGLKHYQFIDRVGDTYRWKSENVSTNEVGEILNTYSQVEISNVFGVSVPGAEGRAGMAALKLHEGESLDLRELSQHVNQSLPSYARPVFVRVLQEMQVTGTFKLKKTDLRDAGFDLDSVGGDPIYLIKPGNSEYEPLSPDFLQVIQAGKAGY